VYGEVTVDILFPQNRKKSLQLLKISDSSFSSSDVENHDEDTDMSALKQLRFWVERSIENIKQENEKVN